MEWEYLKVFWHNTWVMTSLWYVQACNIWIAGPHDVPSTCTRSRRQQQNLDALAIGFIERLFT